MNTSDSDDRLAPVIYFPGVPRPSESGSSTEPTRASLPTGLTAPPAGGGYDASGWYVEPTGIDDIEPTSKPDFRPIWVEDSTPESSPAPVVPPLATAPVVRTAPAIRESPAMKKMRLLIESADAAPGATSKQQHPSGREQSPRGTSGNRFAREDAADVPESFEELAARAESISMSALTRKGMSSWEMAQKLQGQDLDEETIANEVARLERVGLLDDRFLAETLVRTLQERKALGRSGITAELRRRHVDPEAIEEALDAFDGDDEVARATEVALRRAPQLRSLDTATAKRRLSAFLMRKGYSGSVISAAVSAALEPGAGPRFR